MIDPQNESEWVLRLLRHNDQRHAKNHAVGFVVSGVKDCSVGAEIGSGAGRIQRGRLSLNGACCVWQCFKVCWNVRGNVE